jgi:hypothetical protein
MTDRSGEPLGVRAMPEVLAVDGPNEPTLEFLRSVEVTTIAEIGIYRGLTSVQIAEYLDGRGELHLFDFEDLVADVSGRLKAAGHDNVVVHGNSRKLLDSYNWSLMKLLRESAEPVFDYVFLDGAHTWAVDGFAFFLIDRLLKVGGYLDLDDYGWSLGQSPTMNPDVFPMTGELHTDEQIGERQVALVVDLLVRRDPRYEQVVGNRIFRKASA